VIAAVGRAGIEMDPERAEVRYAGERVLRRGMKVDRQAERRAVPKIRRKSYGIDVDLGVGKGRSFVYFSDLGHEYIRINAGYRT
jgi:glutamate N-acetyltransferase/amino-acid N-acetyltransferase